jgi:hypothetical protein
MDTDFLTEKLPSYANPTDDIRFDANLQVWDGGCTMLQCFSIRMLSACFCVFEEVREHFDELILPENIFMIVNDAGSEDAVVAAGLKLVAELCSCKKTQKFVEMLDVANVGDRIVRTGTYRSRVSFWRLAKVLIKCQSPKGCEFLLEPGLLAQAVGQIDPETPKLSLMIIDYLIAVCEEARRIGKCAITKELETTELRDTLSSIKQCYSRTVLNDRIDTLFGMLDFAVAQ